MPKFVFEITRVTNVTVPIEIEACDADHAYEIVYELAENRDIHFPASVDSVSYDINEV